MTAPVPASVEPCQYCGTRPAAGSGRPCCCNFLEIPDTERAAAIETLLQLRAWEKRRSDGTEISVEFQVRALTDPNYRAALVEILADLKNGLVP